VDNFVGNPVVESSFPRKNRLSFVCSKIKQAKNQQNQRLMTVLRLRDTPMFPLVAMPADCGHPGAIKHRKGASRAFFGALA
jgi:hypothetical protein